LEKKEVIKKVSEFYENIEKFNKWKWGELFEVYFKLCEKNNRAIEEWRCK